MYKFYQEMLGEGSSEKIHSILSSKISIHAKILEYKQHKLKPNAPKEQ